MFVATTRLLKRQRSQEKGRLGVEAATRTATGKHTTKVTGQTMRLFEGTPFDRPPRCERCGQLEADCQCPPAPPAPPPRVPPSEQTARLSVEKRKKGKVVTVVRGLSVEGNDLPGLLTQLKAACGAGGTLKEGDLEIQGKHLDRVRQLLKTVGYRVKG
jgi:translation initiation factor 1